MYENDKTAYLGLVCDGIGVCEDEMCLCCLCDLVDVTQILLIYE